jgi:glycosyltransferase involved in cell wall biosynthesis
MDYRPNVDAVLWFADEVWPLICEKRPSTTWAVVGQIPHARLQRIQGIPGMTMTGWVESVRPYLAGASVYIMPFRIGSGTRLKLIEAMAAGKAIVSTTVGAEGFPAQSGEQLLLADSAQAMATAVLQLLDNPQKREQFGRMASQLAQQYDWRQVIPRFQEVYMQIVR